MEIETILQKAQEISPDLAVVYVAVGIAADGVAA